MFRTGQGLGIPLALCLVATMALTGVSFAPRSVAAAAVRTSVTVRPGTVAPGGQITVSGRGFAPDESVDVKLTPHATPIATIQANARGVAPATSVTIPTTFHVGVHTLTLVGRTSHRTVGVSLTLTAAPVPTKITITITLTPATVAPGAQVNVSGTGFRAHEMVDVLLGARSTPIATIRATARGVVPVTAVTIPSTFAPRTYTLKLVGRSSHRVVGVHVTVVSLSPRSALSSTTALRGAPRDESSLLLWKAGN